MKHVDAPVYNEYTIRLYTPGRINLKASNFGILGMLLAFILGGRFGEVTKKKK